MYVILQGEVGIFFDDKLERCVVTLGQNKQFGARSLQNREVRTAHVQALCETHVLILHKSDFEREIFHILHVQKLRRERFIKNMDLFKEWPSDKLSSLNSKMFNQKYSAGDVIYDIGSNPDVFYILYQGCLNLETEITLEESNRFPRGKNRWEVITQQKRVVYGLRQINPGEAFGHQELIAEINRIRRAEGQGLSLTPGKEDPEEVERLKSLEIKRKYRVSAIRNCEVIYINREDFEKIMSQKNLEDLYEGQFIYDETATIKKVKSLYEQERVTNRVIGNCAQKNMSNVNDNRGQARE